MGHALDARGEVTIRITDTETQSDYNLDQLDLLLHGLVAGNA